MSSKPPPPTPGSRESRLHIHRCQEPGCWRCYEHRKLEAALQRMAGDERARGEKLYLLVEGSMPYHQDLACQVLTKLGGMTLQEVGQSMGCTRERIRQIEEEALKKVRAFLSYHQVDLERELEELGVDDVAGADYGNTNYLIDDG